MPKRMHRPLFLALSFMLAACGLVTMDSGIIRSHMLIKEGRYKYYIEDSLREVLEFQSDGKGREITHYPYLDSTVWLFDWKTVDWSDGRLRLVTRYYSYQQKQDRKSLNSTVYQDLKDVTDSSFSLCSASRETCQGLTNWRAFLREN